MSQEECIIVNGVKVCSINEKNQVYIRNRLKEVEYKEAIKILLRAWDPFLKAVKISDVNTKKGKSNFVQYINWKLLADIIGTCGVGILCIFKFDLITAGIFIMIISILKDWRE